MANVNQLVEYLDQCILSNYGIATDGQGLKLTEQDPNSTCPDISIKKDGPVRAYCFEPGKDVMPYFNDSIPGLTKMCDAILFYPRQQANQVTIFVFLCELKSGQIQSAKQGAIPQLKSSLSFAKFLLEKIELFAGQKFDVAYRSIICTPKASKRFKASSPKSKPKYHENGALKWIAHPAEAPIHLQHYCC